MSIVAFLIGITLPTLNGWLLLGLLEWTRPVLLRLEQWVMGCVIGLAFTMLLTFVAHTLTHLPLTLLTFLAVQFACMIIFIGIFLSQRKKFTELEQFSVHPAASKPLSRGWKIFLGIFLTWTIAKIVILAITFTLMPSFLDDTLDNWNLRAKVYYVDQALTLVLPNEDPATSPLGVSSYPPAIPLMKTWLATLNGAWNDSLINSIHSVWFICALLLLYSGLRRFAGRAWSMIGVIILGNIPLYLMHGLNAYADAAMSVYIFIPVYFLFVASRMQEEMQRLSALRLAAFTSALLPFMKNEGLLIFLPPLLLLTILSLWIWNRRGEISMTVARRSAAWFVIALIICALPWLIFKWSHGLTFGNAKSVSGLGFAWQPGVLQAIFINTFFEGNWLLLFPLFFGLLVWKWRDSFSDFVVLTSYILIIYGGQFLIFLFTSLSNEAINQTGYARGIIQLLPLIVFLTIFLLRRLLEPILAPSNPLADESNLGNN